LCIGWAQRGERAVQIRKLALAVCLENIREAKRKPMMNTKLQEVLHGGKTCEQATVEPRLLQWIKSKAK